MWSRAWVLLVVLVGQPGCDAVFGTGTPTPPPPQWAQISGGFLHTCAIRSDRTLWCWGDNEYGQAGIVSQLEVATPMQVGTSAEWELLATGFSHSCAVSRDRSLWCWGSNFTGEIGVGAPASPLPLPPTFVLDDVVAVATGAFFTCAIDGVGTLSCWGDNSRGQLGIGAAVEARLPEVVVGRWKTVDAQLFHVCATTTDDELYCWGNNDAGQVAGQIGLPDGDAVRLPRGFGDGGRWQQLAVGDGHSCGLRVDQSLACWGSNDAGQLGGAGGPGMVEVPSEPGTRWRAVVASLGRACALRDDETQWCWGLNLQGQLAVENAAVLLNPRQIAPETSWLQLTLGSSHLCALDRSGVLMCSGNGDRGQRGGGLRGSRPTPSQVPGSWSKVEVSASATCARNVAGELHCWGNNADQQLGDGSFAPQQRPSFVVGGLQTGQLAVGVRHVCAQFTGANVPAQVGCWGDNATGAVGVAIAPPPQQASVGTPTSQTGVVTATSTLSLAAGDGFSCKVGTSAVMYCWGDNRQRQLAAPPSAPDHMPRPVTGSWQQVTAGDAHACGVAENTKQVLCWGANDRGERGSTSMNDGPVVIAASGVMFAAVVAGAQHTCAIDTTRQLWCWGANGAGQVGDASRTDRFAPRPLAGPWLKVALGAAHTCALDAGDRLYCWGSNARSQLGLAVPAEALEPTRVGDELWTQVAAGGETTCAIKADDSLWCWGSNRSGQIGDDSAWSSALEPVVMP